jgi:hypothetical protein
MRRFHAECGLISPSLHPFPVLRQTGQAAFFSYIAQRAMQRMLLVINSDLQLLTILGKYGLLRKIA